MARPLDLAPFRRKWVAAPGGRVILPIDSTKVRRNARYQCVWRVRHRGEPFTDAGALDLDGTG
jgi:hypothetical protein